ncbi:MAG: hypothetical protein JKY54_11035 [Flavobacteriales bacterium]|nr:hypothetical protein [Flavobacteriales bacterium]
MRIPLITIYSLLLLLACGITSENIEPNEKPAVPLVRVEEKSTDGGDEYTFMYLDSAELNFEVTRPSKDSAKVLLCVAAAFTDLGDFEIDGLYLNDGVIRHQTRINKTLGGGLLKTADGISLIDTRKGSIFNDSTLATYADKKASLFQQILIIRNGKPESFKAERYFQRRAVVTTNDGQLYIVENTDALTLAQFCKDLVSLDTTIKNALYLDMGSWDEGWYRHDKDSTVVIGQNRSSTAHQSNWLVFERK